MLLVACDTEPRTDGATATSEQRPNVLLIVADDMGYSDLGAWGSEIRTPHLDALAFEGVRFTNFHAAPVWRPPRVGHAHSHVAVQGGQKRVFRS